MARRDGLRVRFERIRGETPSGVLTQPLIFPAMLGDFTVAEEAAFREYDTVGLGQLAAPAPGRNARQLQTTDLETLTIEWDPAWLVQNGVNPERLRTELYNILRSRRPFRLGARLMHGASAPFEARFRATLRGVERTLKTKEGDTRYYTLRVSEDREPHVGRQATTTGRGNLPTTKRLDANDTLYSLSKHYYGSSISWQHIARANGIRGWGPGTALVKAKRYKVGDKIKIPKLPVATINRPRR